MSDLTSLEKVLSSFESLLAKTADPDLVDWNRVSPSFREVIRKTWRPLPPPPR